MIFTENKEPQNKFINDIRNKYLNMNIAELASFKSSYNPRDYTPEARLIIEEVLKQKEDEINEYLKELNEKETRYQETEKGILWKIYFFFIAILHLLSSFTLEGIELLASLIGFILLVASLYSWIWAKRINWLYYFRWLIKIWSIQIFIMPIALLVHLFLLLYKGHTESANWIIVILLYFPFAYAIYRLTWKSKLLQRHK